MRRLIVFVLVLTACGGSVETASRVSMVEPADIAGFTAGIEQREPDLMGVLSEDQMVQFGVRACELTDGYVNGSRPTPSELLAEELVSAGVPDDVAGDLADAIRNAATSDTICVRSIEES